MGSDEKRADMPCGISALGDIGVIGICLCDYILIAVRCGGLSFGSLHLGLGGFGALDVGELKTEVLLFVDGFEDDTDD